MSVQCLVLSVYSAVAFGQCETELSNYSKLIRATNGALDSYQLRSQTFLVMFLCDEKTRKRRDHRRVCEALGGTEPYSTFIMSVNVSVSQDRFYTAGHYLLSFFYVQQGFTNFFVC